jgi:hypothetical protein
LTTTTLFESSTIDESVELVDADMMATIVVCRMVDCRICCCCWMDLIKVQLLGNEGLSQVCFLEIGHFGLITPVFWLIKSRTDEAQKTELMGYHPSCFSKKTWLSCCPDKA